MKISYNWLKDYINIEVEPSKLSVILTNIGLEVEAVEPYQSIRGGLEGFVVGEVKTCVKHANADKLSVTTVDIGTGSLLPIVCGAPNVAAGQRVVVATVGTILYSGDSQFTIEKRKIRGENSEGMICAEDEIGLGQSHAGIMVLPADTPIGMKAKEYFKVVDDVIFTIGLTPNRIDDASHIGVARDLISYFALYPSENPKPVRLLYPDISSFKVDNETLTIPVSVENTTACPRYCGVTISGVTVKESPDWLQNKLKAIGQRPINNIVDITNFVLHEYGQPLHAFDVSQISGKKVVVKTLAQDTKFTTLDMTERALHEQDLMICNANEGMCIAGVFGGAKSGVTETTKDVFLESAYFNPVSIRKTSKRHTLSTDASFRFERGIDPNNTMVALKRAAVLIKEVAGGEISAQPSDFYPTPIQDFRIDVTYKNIHRIIGKQIPIDNIKTIIVNQNIQIVSETHEGLSLLVPAYKVDVKTENDIVEEILRIYGFNNIEIPEHVSSTLVYANKPDKEKWRNNVSDFLSNRGFHEIMCNSLTKISYYENNALFPIENLVKIMNPLSSDLGCMRQSLVYGALESVIYNINRKNTDLFFYEFGNVYFFNKPLSGVNPVGEKYTEEMKMSMVICGNTETENWKTKGSKSDFYLLKSHVVSVLKKLGLDTHTIEHNEISNTMFAYGFELFLEGKMIGVLGLLQPVLCKKFDIDTEVYYAELNWRELLNRIPALPRYKELPKFPEVRRDLALLIDKQITFAELRKLAVSTENKLLKSVDIFDVYESDKLGQNKKSYALSFTLSDDSKTLTDSEIDKIMQKLTTAFQQKLGATLR